ncbi:NAD(P)-dependent oxidoreductase [Staphylococcus pettenkoferi]|uniref:6-phosphogluconate dehydrogenase, decarboxylating n=2 Tax=Bacillota TaxID=1239 RepID=A0A9Q4D9P6_9STAP|nr:NAD(P)-dependent oxidoreductase [Staphylococcus pettenkoferi]MCY1568415.1 NAD(P)-dependent oxidoreductase [Staphylococcus pettenkoferi]MCY1576441.1 NAD(P)-dependent oxidoreductase [Staphylococcus pettenkoferi]MCY1594966.1 NAD(P)-dependent oxidoreductase [Staphylococcus pettenkoferi]MCY1617016.1 NAD(P)-dependent oxidoreductase [Staphylococcus pettenkoferi]
MKKIGFVGLGNMGAGMAMNLQKSGFQVLAYDLDKDKIKELEKEGIQGCESIQEVTDQVDDAVITMVRNQAQTEDVIFGDKGITSSDNNEVTVVVMSTLNPTIMEDLEKKVSEYELNLLDAPVSGSLSGAEKGSLAIFSSGAQETKSQLKPYFEAMGSHIFDLGDKIGAGQAAKLANNLLLGINMVGISEAVKFGNSYGLNEEDVLDIVEVSTGNSWAANNWGEIKEYKNNGTLDAIYKDLTSVIAESTKNKTFVPVSGLVLNVLHNSMDSEDNQNK